MNEGDAPKKLLEGLKFAQTGEAVSIRGVTGEKGTSPVAIKRLVAQSCGEDAELIPIDTTGIEIVGQISGKSKSQFFPFEVSDVSTISIELSDNPNGMYFGISNIYSEEIVEQHTGQRRNFSQLLAPGRYCVFVKMYRQATVFRLKTALVSN